MAKVEDCPGFETFGADVKTARKAKHLTRKDLAEKVNIESPVSCQYRERGDDPQPSRCDTAYHDLRPARGITTSIPEVSGRKAKIGNVSATS